MRNYLIVKRICNIGIDFANDSSALIFVQNCQSILIFGSISRQLSVQYAEYQVYFVSNLLLLEASHSGINDMVVIFSM